ncbi:MAG: sugar kinase [Anabaena sp. CoA2_C59]|jgi:sugar/nucleoside kinase (ribokinase family)|uniref:Sugar kinase n=1 Tax=Aphanizomenon flos-aquae FACHB-1249 TaxID=2692889 RepID=A0ABR8IUN9_APHFL|nr:MULTISPECIES: sugar kinase [Aphanizomenon]MCE2906152.1 sugar kinase [Anabaena sp. CoA2_C59]MDJ0505600.1 sugar kinase [Nostocales cyanobacterium LE14-WE12]MBD2389191.1 sugar kinase [Aphanizomenon flos-aquae FACHB-1171]MBD2556285.1 sugar kinase [Aphanizomenon flos-aquae FACHB-1290]MBD2632788.1 sugar kinase [Aphanizomenon sp. FACHB-1399]
MIKSALFVGLITLDFIYLADSPPQNNQKLVATDYTVAAGGPATNAAVTFSHLGNKATILGVLGSHPMKQLICTDLENCQVAIIDLDPHQITPPPVSSIIVTQGTGERAVISINAVKTQANITSIPPNILENIDIILIDGHQMAISFHLAQTAKTHNIPIVIDGGSWKPGFAEILPFVNYALCSANFYPPNCKNQQDVFNYLQDFNIPHIAITQGENPIQYLTCGQSGVVNVPKIQTVDTLGAGDIFHGAFCNYILQTSFIDALALAGNIATNACKYFGTRHWMNL